MTADPSVGSRLQFLSSFIPHLHPQGACLRCLRSQIDLRSAPSISPSPPSPLFALDSRRMPHFEFDSDAPPGGPFPAHAFSEIELKLSSGFKLQAARKNKRRKFPRPSDFSAEDSIIRTSNLMEMLVFCWLGRPRSPDLRRLFFPAAYFLPPLIFPSGL